MLRFNSYIIYKKPLNFIHYEYYYNEIVNSFLKIRIYKSWEYVNESMNDYEKLYLIVVDFFTCDNDFAAKSESFSCVKSSINFAMNWWQKENERFGWNKKTPIVKKRKKLKYLTKNRFDAFNDQCFCFVAVLSSEYKWRKMAATMKNQPIKINTRI